MIQDIKDTACPAPAYVEWRFNDVGDTGCTAESLTECESKEEAAQEKFATRAAAEKADTETTTAAMAAAAEETSPSENVTMSPVQSRKLRVRKCASLAEIIKHDPEDPMLTYKVTFLDGPRRGMSDWVAAGDVEVFPDDSVVQRAGHKDEVGADRIDRDDGRVSMKA